MIELITTLLMLIGLYRVWSWIATLLDRVAARSKQRRAIAMRIAEREKYERIRNHVQTTINEYGAECEFMQGLPRINPFTTLPNVNPDRVPCQKQSTNN